MAYEVVITDAATKELKRLPAKMQDRIFEKIEKLAEDPKPSGHKKLKNYTMRQIQTDEYFRIRVGNYRVIYTIENEEVKIFILKIAHRKEAY